MKLLTNILKTLSLASLFVVSTYANETFVHSKNTKLAVEYTFDASVAESIDKEFFSFTDKPLAEIGFFVNDAHHNVNDVYEKQVGETYLDQLAFSSLINDDIARPLFNTDPRIGGFTPFNLVIYRKKSNMKTVITHITPEAAIDILQIKDKNVKEQFVKMFEPLDEKIEKKFKNASKSYTTLQGYASESVMNFEIPFDKPEDVDDFFDEFQEVFEAAFEKKGYIIAGFYNMKYSLNSDDTDVLPMYNQYVVWSLCHIPFSYTIFDGKNATPEAAIFAPCSMYAYIKEGENKIIIGMPTLASWAAALGISDKDKLEKIRELDRDIPAVLKSLGAKKLPNINPLKN